MSWFVFYWVLPLPILDVDDRLEQFFEWNDEVLFCCLVNDDLEPFGMFRFFNDLSFSIEVASTLLELIFKVFSEGHLILLELFQLLQVLLGDCLLISSPERFLRFL